MSKPFHYGGQAVIEGVMMRGANAAVTAVRRPNGELAINAETLPTLYRGWPRRTPFLRGVIVLIESLALGVKSILFSANAALGEEEEELSGLTIALMLTLSLGLAVALFFVTPLVLTRLLLPLVKSTLTFNLVEGIIRLAIFVVYLKVMSLMPDIRRVFAYHGAEHKTVNAFEAGAPMEVAAIRKYNKAHVRCGTSFLLVVLVIAIFVFAFVGLPSIAVLVVSRIVLVPVIAALGYEFVHFGADHATNRVVKALMAPGLMLQSLTTREPDDSQIEVAVAALNKAIEADRAEVVA
ncbi:MAG: DUF1385 domain-containing protein [Chloroflexi bacterium]|nr:DUF1385 domain-containing protein [Chloroflexota bacterium]MBI4267430.1 DUF1385 domain-containing protein [Chloroflexota bacterium]